MEMTEILVDEALRANAQQVLANKGFTISEAAGIFFRAVVHDQTMPAAYRVPNETTLAATREAKSGTLSKYTDAEKFIRSLREDNQQIAPVQV